MNMLRCRGHGRLSIDCVASKLHPGFLIRRLYARRVYRSERALVGGTRVRCDGGLHGEDRRSLIQD